jgi:hypothetical protein
MHPEDTGAVPKHTTLYAWAWLVQVREANRKPTTSGGGWLGFTELRLESNNSEQELY